MNIYEEYIEDWFESFDSFKKQFGDIKAKYLINQLGERLSNEKYESVNTILSKDDILPSGNIEREIQLMNYIRWNSTVTVLRANSRTPGIGGHISTYLSISTIYEVCFNYFFKGTDHVFFQGHSSPGIYARAVLEGRLSFSNLNNFRIESNKGGLSSYPHPRLMRDFWQFPTVSMGLGISNGISQAKFNRYMLDHKLINIDPTVWIFAGDGEMDEPESVGLLRSASYNQLNNIVLVINCNLQRLDSLVRANGNIISELENLFIGCNWNVIKVLWNSSLSSIIEDNDISSYLIERLSSITDVEHQSLLNKSKEDIIDRYVGDRDDIRNRFMNLSDEDITYGYGGHDYIKLYNAFLKATSKDNSKPTVILVRTVKGYGLGSLSVGKNNIHQLKGINKEILVHLKNKLNIPIEDSELDFKYPQYYKYSKDDLKYAISIRKKLGGFLPARKTNMDKNLSFDISLFKQILYPKTDISFSTVMVFTQLISLLLRSNISNRIVPIVPDEGRTFGLDNLYSKIGVYSSHESSTFNRIEEGTIFDYKEDKSGVIIQEGINEVAGVGTLIASGSSYSSLSVSMIPFYLFYSIFGFQRTGDIFWALGDQLVRGFAIGCLAGGTSLAGEGLQHIDSTSPVLATCNPHIKVYDPCFSYEIAHIIHDGINRMYSSNDEFPNGEDLFYYITAYNVAYKHIEEPKGINIKNLIKGVYKFYSSEDSKCNLFASGIALRWILDIKDILNKKYNVDINIFSVTSWKEIRFDLLNSNNPLLKYYLSKYNLFSIFISDYISLNVEQIARWIDKDRALFLGSNEYGISDSNDNLRSRVGLDNESIIKLILDKIKR